MCRRARCRWLLQVALKRELRLPPNAYPSWPPVPTVCHLKYNRLHVLSYHVLRHAKRSAPQRHGQRYEVATAAPEVKNAKLLPLSALHRLSISNSIPTAHARNCILQTFETASATRYGSNPLRTGGLAVAARLGPTGMRAALMAGGLPTQL